MGKKSSFSFIQDTTPNCGHQGTKAQRKKYNKNNPAVISYAIFGEQVK